MTRAILLLCLSISTAHASESFPPLFLEAHTKSGTRVLVAPTEGVPLVRIAYSIRAGSSDDDAGARGLSCLVAHALDDGNHLSRKLLELGGQLRIECSEEATHYQIALPMRHLGEAITRMTSALTAPKWNEPDFARTRGRHASELATEEAEPRRQSELKFRETIFGATGWGHVADGVAADVERIPFVAGVHFWRKHYVAPKVVLSVVGPVTLEEVITTARPLLGLFRDGAPPETTRISATAAAAIDVKTTRADAPQASVHLGHASITRDAPEYAAAEMAAMALGGSFTSRLVQNLREKKGYTYGISARFVTGRRAGYFVIRTELRSDVAQKGLAEIDRELARFAATLTDAEVEKSKRLFRAGFVEQFESGDGVLELLVEMAELDLAVDAHAKTLEEVAALDLAKVREVAARLLKAKERVRAIVGP